MIVEHRMEIRVRYHETDGQGRVHHAQYLNYFERGRVELMRSLGHSYRELEQNSDLMLVVTEMNVKYASAASFDELLELNTRVVRSKGVRIFHEYSLTSLERADQPLVVSATSVIACIDRTGKVRPLPDFLRG